MPLHDWTRVPSGLFHDFHQSWSVRIAEALNQGLLPSSASALIEWKTAPATASAAHLASHEAYAAKANRIVVRHRLQTAIAVIELVSPGNKVDRRALSDFVETMLEFLRTGIHVLLIDLFPPTSRDPNGIHKLIWDKICEEEFSLPPGQDRVFVSYQVGAERAAYIEPAGVGKKMPDMPLFLTKRLHAMVPLESTYMATWSASPEALRVAVESGILPDRGAE